MTESKSGALGRVSWWAVVGGSVLLIAALVGRLL